ncbi:radical SAM family heme chaperone HemW [Mesohalobacter halotolerans]|uniref:Heme chaperone HemW n=1 Tax=Mesohalobacter halotolerans TaxID=1883405 RepID=A0A4U5TS13_9FLAO|nr:radical SAM family heme chaperone HemW [Mesohalobacter halotolerans]TKS56906.1 radical SAM family heme chaperone HemW [Mesohalobacter halotolerans]
MASIYIHIPFCKQACHYCDFHFSTSLKHKDNMVEAICNELILRKDEFQNSLECIYFGGGTPSLLSETDLDQIFKTIYKYYQVADHPEITLEANPDDITDKLLKTLKFQGINRLSLGVQSFFEKDLKLMNRAHDVEEAKNSINLVKQYFDNYSIDLIYGMPDMDLVRWQKNLEIALDFGIPHLSCYALTVEPNTALNRFIEKDIIAQPDEEQAAAHFGHLYNTMTSRGFEHYEFSNFGKPGYFSQNNINYWTGKPYLGIGPSGNSYDGKNKRTWNIKNNLKYIKAINDNQLPQTTENLTKTDLYNEYIMTRLRTKWGVNIDDIKTQFGEAYLDYLMLQAQSHLDLNQLEIRQNHIHITREAKFLSDGIAADLFKIEF